MLIFSKGLAIFCGSLLIGIGLNAFLAPHHLIDGGLMGLGLILFYAVNIPVGMSMLILNFPIYLYAFFKERSFFYNGICGLLFSSLFAEYLSFLYGDFLLPVFESSILGGVCVGIGIGLMLRYDTSSDGVDLIAQFVSKFWAVNVGLTILLIDLFIMVAGMQVIGWRAFCYSVLVISVGGLMIMLLTVTKRQAS
ncbi:YitT family protein [Bacillus sp. CGMCC 1.16541]|uniref:YitT family protein n=1 Tax=Bacillus sp. CGMCC 1.16541 TaxID=2185143 RepID=UPI000D72C8BF|nr:YitT family protein [Bacillus sp. CGMCC 1.16541]